MTRFVRMAAAIAVAATVFLAGCASTGGSVKGGKPKAVEDRAVKRWELLIAGQTADAYDYLAPGYQKTKAKDEYAKEYASRPVHWTSVKYMDKDCHEGDTCTVRVYVTYKVKFNVAVPTTDAFSILEEKWIKDAKGEWVYLPDRLGGSTLK